MFESSVWSAPQNGQLTAQRFQKPGAKRRARTVIRIEHDTKSSGSDAGDIDTGENGFDVRPMRIVNHFQGRHPVPTDIPSELIPIGIRDPRTCLGA